MFWDLSGVKCVSTHDMPWGQEGRRRLGNHMPLPAGREGYGVADHRALPYKAGDGACQVELGECECAARKSQTQGAWRLQHPRQLRQVYAVYQRAS